MSDDERDIFDRADMIESVLNQHTFQIDEIRSSLKLLCQDRKVLTELAEKTADNMKRLNQMMLELKALVAIVRPQVKKTGWYGDELKSSPLSIATDAIDPPKHKLSEPLRIDIDINSTE